MQVRTTYDGGGLGRGADLVLVVDGLEVAATRLERTVPFGYSIVESLNVGLDWGTPVSPRYSRDRGNPYTDDIVAVTLTAGDDAVEPTQQRHLDSVLATH